MEELRKKAAEEAAQVEQHRASFILHELHPRVVHDDVIAAARAELEAAAQASADAAWEEAKTKAADQRRE